MPPRRGRSRRASIGHTDGQVECDPRLYATTHGTRDAEHRRDGASRFALGGVRPLAARHTIDSRIDRSRDSRRLSILRGTSRTLIDNKLGGDCWRELLKDAGLGAKV